MVSATHSSIVDDYLEGYGAKFGTLGNTSKQRIKCMLNCTVSDLHMNIPGIDSNNHKDMANAINTKFVVSHRSHIEPLNISILPAYLPVDDTPPTLHPWEVYKELKAIKSSKASGPDGIPPKLIKEFAYELSSPSQMCLIVLSEKGLYLIDGNLPLLFPSSCNIPLCWQYDTYMIDWSFCQDCWRIYC